MSYQGDNRRQTDRTHVHDHLLVADIKSMDEQTTTQGMIVNSSANGVQISLPAEITANSKVEIALTNQAENSVWKSKKYMGKVCWCQPDGSVDGLFNAGIQFVELLSVM